MKPPAIFFIIFGVCVLLAGLYLYTGHDSQFLLWRDHKKHHDKAELENIGKWTIIASGVIFFIALLMNL